MAGVMLQSVSNLASVRVSGDHLAVSTTVHPQTVTLVERMKVKFDRDLIAMVSSQDGALKIEPTFATERKHPSAFAKIKTWLDEGRYRQFIL
jgi:hypothetical protein